MGVELSSDGGTRCSVAEKPWGNNDFLADTRFGARYVVRAIFLHPRGQATMAGCRGRNMQQDTIIFEDRRARENKLGLRFRLRWKVPALRKEVKEGGLSQSGEGSHHDEAKGAGENTFHMSSFEERCISQ